jgi:hypothetical protein
MLRLSLTESLETVVKFVMHPKKGMGSTTEEHG